MKKLHDMWFIIRLAYKNMWFKRRMWPLVGLGCIIVFPSWNNLLDVYKLGGFIPAAFVLFLAAVGIFLLFPMAILWVDLQKDPKYIERLATTLPEYYNR